MLKPLFLLSLMLSPFVMASSNAATYYKWTDKNGVPHYSQYAPTNGVNLRQVQVVNTRELGPSSRAPATAGNSTGAASGASPTLTADQKRAAELEAQNQQLKKQQDAERCKSLQNTLANLNQGGRVYEMDDKGERKYLDGREIELRRQQVAQTVSQYCK